MPRLPSEDVVCACCLFGVRCHWQDLPKDTFCFRCSVHRDTQQSFNTTNITEQRQSSNKKMTSNHPNVLRGGYPRLKDLDPRLFELVEGVEPIPVKVEDVLFALSLSLLRLTDTVVPRCWLNWSTRRIQPSWKRQMPTSWCSWPHSSRPQRIRSWPSNLPVRSSRGRTTRPVSSHPLATS